MDWRGVGATAVYVSLFFVVILAPWVGPWPAVAVFLVVFVVGLTLFICGG